MASTCFSCSATDWQEFTAAELDHEKKDGHVCLSQLSSAFPPEVCDLQERRGRSKVREGLPMEGGASDRQVGVALIGGVGVVKTEATRPAFLLLNIKSAAQQP